MVKGRFAPSPSGRMHLGNIYSALVSWLSAKSQGGSWLLRIEDLDPGRSKSEYARLIEDDLHWLGLDWDEGGLDDRKGFYCQSNRGDIYEEALNRLKELNLVYPCTCSRAEIMASQAPHESDGRIVYSGKCRPENMNNIEWSRKAGEKAAAVRLKVEDRDISFIDGNYGSVTVNLAEHCGDFVLKRSDGAWAYQLAVVVDDALMGVTEVVRGRDLLLSTAQQLYLYNILGYDSPHFSHIPLLCSNGGSRLCKRDKSLDMSELRKKYQAEEIIGQLAHIAGITKNAEPCSPASLISSFSWDQIPDKDIIL